MVAQVIKVLQLEAPLSVLPLDMHNASHSLLVGVEKFLEVVPVLS